MLDCFKAAVVFAGIRSPVLTACRLLGFSLKDTVTESLLLGGVTKS